MMPSKQEKAAQFLQELDTFLESFGPQDVSDGSPGQGALKAGEPSSCSGHTPQVLSLLPSETC